jgi:hypothetical protein
MNTYGTVEDLGATSSPPPDSDSRWRLVQRIVASEEFQRAAQLRNILLYVSRAAIQHPDTALHEYQIACDVLGRQADFNPALDNIVRAQVSHLRRKLAQYYEREGKNEPIVVTIPKGSYLPAFTAQALITEQPAPFGSLPASSVATLESKREQHSSLLDAPRRRWRPGVVWGFIGCFLVGAVGSSLLLRLRTSDAPRLEKAERSNEFVQFLARSEGEVSVVVPDLSLAILTKMIGQDISLTDYVTDGFPSNQLAQVKDPLQRQALARVVGYRNTTINEAMIASDFKDCLQRTGARVRIRYSRDLHVADLSQGNSILIGGQSSNPWTSPFADRLNFRRKHSADYTNHFFENLHPKPGEPSQYKLIYAEDGHPGVGYVDVAYTPNPSKTGYVLIIDGADAQASEAAARFLLHGKLPPEIVSVLERKNLTYFEFFLRGRHLKNESDDTFELVATRP